MDTKTKIQTNKLEYQVPYFEAVEFEYSDVIQVSICPQDKSTNSSVDFWTYFETE